MKSQSETYKIIIADDHGILRAGLKSLIDNADELEVVGEAQNGKELMTTLEGSPCDLIILDLSMPEMNGLEALEVLNEKYPDISILILTMHKDRDYFKEALTRGVKGYILKDDVYDKLITAINEIRAGRKSFSSEIQNRIIEDYSTIHQNQKSVDVLTKREKEILKHIAGGAMNKDIASTLNISVRTVEFHRANIMEKLNIKNVAGLVKFAISRGLT